MYTKIFIIIIILILFISINFLLKKKKEKFGVYCGRYNLNKGDAEKNCKGDDECKWFTNINSSSSTDGWCGQNPEGAAKPNKNIFSDNISTEENNSDDILSNLENQFDSFF